MSFTNYPDKYLQVNTQQSKRLCLVVAIEGVPNYFSLTDIYSRVRYGDPGITYGFPGLVYGSLRKRDDVLPYLTLDGSLTISQRLEPEQGRASISTFTLVFVDKDGFMTKLCSPGGVITEPLGGPEVKIYLGYQNTSFPDDYFVVFRGNISGCQIQGPNCTLTISDPNQRRRQPVFTPGLTELTADIDAVQTTIPVTSTSTFPVPVLGPDGTYDQNFLSFILIDSEWMKVVSQTVNSFTVVRNSPPVGEISAADVHTNTTSVSGGVQLGTDLTSPRGIHCITAALKIMLSGWGGPWISGEPALMLGKTLDPMSPITNVIRLPPSKDGVEDYGLSIGDYVTVSGSTLGNNGTYTIQDIRADATGRANRLLVISQNLAPEDGGTLAFRSQFDTLPNACGVKMKPTEVDVATHVFIRNNYLSGTENNMQFCLLAEVTGKDFVESELYLPVGVYSLTRYGRLSVGYTRPAVAGTKLVVLNADNIIDPDKISVSRSLINRRFYNEVDYQYDKSESQGTFNAAAIFADFTSTENFRQTSVLPIDSGGIRSTLGGGILVQKRGRALLTRFKNAAVEVSLKVNWQAGSLIESGDVVVVQDNGTLKIPNLISGTRDIGVQLFEVIDRKLDVRNGNCQLILLSGIFDTRTDRYGVVSPSSKLDTGSTTTKLRIKPSYGALYGSDEFRKWLPYLSLNIRVHSYDYTQDATVVLDSISGTESNTLILASALPFTPSADMIIDLAPYPTSTDPNEQAYAKLVNAYVSPSVPVTGGSSQTVFTVSGPDAALFQVGAVVSLHNQSYTQQSPEAKVVSVSGTIITVDTALGFTPSSSHTVEFIGFPDGKGAYRFL